MNELRQKVRRIKLELNLSDRELSKRLGKSPTYLSKIFEVGISTARQKALSDELDMVVKGHKFVSTAERLEIINKQSEHNRNCATKYLNQVNDLKQELSDNQEELKIQADQNIGLTHANTELSKEIQNLKSMLDKVDTVNDNLNKENAELAEKLGFKTKQCFELEEQINIKDHNERNLDQKVYDLQYSQKIHRLLSLVCLATIILLIITQWGV